MFRYLFDKIFGVKSSSKPCAVVGCTYILKKSYKPVLSRVKDRKNGYVFYEILSYGCEKIDLFNNESMKEDDFLAIYKPYEE